MIKEKPINLGLESDLKDDEFRKHFLRSLAQTEVAEQIMKMRSKRKMRQIDLARKIETGQSAISRIEQAEYASWNFQTLLNIAEALRARLRIRLEPIEDVIDQQEDYTECDQEISTTEDDVTSMTEICLGYTWSDFTEPMKASSSVPVERQSNEYSAAIH